MSKHGPDTRSSWQVFVAVALGVMAGTVAAVGALAVIVAGFALSFDAIRAVGWAAHMREDWAWLLPVSVDGAMAVATVAAVVQHRLTGKTAWYPWTVVLVGAAISVACNGLHAIGEHGQPLKLDAEIRFAVSAIPAVMVAMSVHLLVMLIDVAAKRVERPAGERPEQMAPGQPTSASTPPFSTASASAPLLPLSSTTTEPTGPSTTSFDGPIGLEPVSSPELRSTARMTQLSTLDRGSHAPADASARSAPRRESVLRTVPPAQRSTSGRTTSQPGRRSTVHERPRTFTADGERSRLTDRVGAVDAAEDLEQTRLKRVREFMAENPGLKIGEVDEQMAEELGLAPRSIRRLREKLRDQAAVGPGQDVELGARGRQGDDAGMDEEGDAGEGAEKPVDEPTDAGPADAASSRSDSSTVGASADAIERRSDASAPGSAESVCDEDSEDSGSTSRGTDPPRAQASGGEAGEGVPSIPREYATA